MRLIGYKRNGIFALMYDAWVSETRQKKKKAQRQKQIEFMLAHGVVPKELRKLGKQQ